MSGALMAAAIAAFNRATMSFDTAPGAKHPVPAHVLVTRQARFAHRRQPGREGRRLRVW